MHDIVCLVSINHKKIQHFHRTFISVSQISKDRIHKLDDLHFTSKIEVVVNVVVNIRNKKATHFREWLWLSWIVDF